MGRAVANLVVRPARDVIRSVRAAPVFALYTLVTLGLAGLFGLMILLMQVQPGFAGMAHFTDPSHRTHELTYAVLFGVAVVGILAQLRRPSMNVAGMLMALAPWLALLLVAVLAGDARVIMSRERLMVAVGTVMAAVLHPAARTYLAAFNLSRVNRVMLGLAVVAAVPLLVFSYSNIGLQSTLNDDHAAQGHYGFMAAFGFTVIAVAVLASLRPEGWWLPAWVAGVVVALVGVISLALPDNSSSLGPIWALASLAWGIAFVAAAELTQTPERPTPLGARGVVRPLRAPAPAASAAADTDARPTGELTGGTARWLNAIGIMALLPIVLFFVLPIGGGPGGLHGPGQDDGQAADASPADHEGETPPIEGAPEIAITADNLAFDLARIEFDAGQPMVNVALTSVDELHDLTVDETGFHVVAELGETSTAGLAGIAFGEPGIYVGYCSVPGHREAGMEVEIIVFSPGNGGPHDPSDRDH